jgi:hypothetical protein
MVRQRQSDTPQRFNIQSQIDAGTAQTVMSKQITDRLDLDPALEQPHGRAVAQAVGSGGADQQTATLDAAREDRTNLGGADGALRATRAQKQMR